MSKLFRVAIDGPGASGKSKRSCSLRSKDEWVPLRVLHVGTTAKLLAKKLGFGYIDTGAMFRAVSTFFTLRSLTFVDLHYRLGYTKMPAKQYQPKRYSWSDWNCPSCSNTFSFARPSRTGRQQREWVDQKLNNHSKYQPHCIQWPSSRNTRKSATCDGEGRCARCHFHRLWT